jgi:hypothetical protein
LNDEHQKTLEGFLTDEEKGRLLVNGCRRREALIAGRECDDLIPVVALLTPDAGCTWLLAALDPTDPDKAYGVCDLCMGYPELGTVSLSELARVRGKFGLPVERHSRRFDPPKTIREYLAEARANGCLDLGSLY